MHDDEETPLPDLKLSTGLEALRAAKIMADAWASCGATLVDPGKLTGDRGHPQPVKLCHVQTAC